MLNEQLERIQSLIYGKRSVLNEQVTNLKNELIGSLKRILSTGGLTIGHIWKKPSKDTQTIQKSLELLGYELPKFGADGLMGNETAFVLKSFINRNIGVNEPITLNKKVISTLINKLIENTPKNINPIRDINTIKQSQPNLKQPMVGNFSKIDLSTDLGFKTYSEICQKFIDRYPPNPLRITGDMLAHSAKMVFDQSNKTIPPELPLAQLKMEGGIGNSDTTIKPIRTRNPFNVGNWDRGRTSSKRTVQDGINAYFKSISTDYLVNRKTPSHLLQNFVNLSGNRYASDPNYENKLKILTRKANQIALGVVGGSNNNIV